MNKKGDTNSAFYGFVLKRNTNTPKTDITSIYDPQLGESYLNTYAYSEGHGQPLSVHSGKGLSCWPIQYSAIVASMKQTVKTLISMQMCLHRH